MGSSLAITNRSLHDQVVSKVRDLIIEGTLEPGSRIDEARLIDELGVSRTPFREAVQPVYGELGLTEMVAETKKALGKQ